MKTSKFDVTLEVTRNEADIWAHTPEGNGFLKEVSENGWSPGQVLANLPPSIKMGFRTSMRKKFTLIPPHSLH